MATATSTTTLPLTDTVAPQDAAGVAAALAQAFAARTPVYPLGGGTSLDYGLLPRQQGLGLALTGLDRVVDYPARDMTVTVEAGVTLARLAETLAVERQWLPIESPQPEQATVGGLVATAWSGPRRYGWGTIRDYVIGISAVDGCGRPFKGGGRVVKNVAGYDFCKLLTGSLGTLGVITQVTLKIRPLPEASAFVLCPVSDWNLAEPLLARLVTTATAPSAIELLAGPAWSEMVLQRAQSSGGGAAAAEESRRQPAAWLLVGFDGAAAEVAWQLDQCRAELTEAGAAGLAVVESSAAGELWLKLRDFAAAPEAPLVLKASVRPSATVEFARLVLEIDPQASVQAHAGNGIVIARFQDFPPAAVSKSLVGRLHPAAVAGGGHAVVLSSQGAADLTRQAVWGGVDAAHAWMTKVRDQFDPAHLLNRGRFIYGQE